MTDDDSQSGGDLDRQSQVEHFAGCYDNGKRSFDGYIEQDDRNRPPLAHVPGEVRYANVAATIPANINSAYKPSKPVCGRDRAEEVSSDYEQN